MYPLVGVALLSIYLVLSPQHGRLSGGQAGDLAAKAS